MKTVEVICKIFKTAFIGNLCREKEETERNRGSFDRRGENGGKLADEFEDSGYFALPIDFLQSKFTMLKKNQIEMRVPNVLGS